MLKSLFALPIVALALIAAAPADPAAPVVDSAATPAPAPVPEAAPLAPAAAPEAPPPAPAAAPEAPPPAPAAPEAAPPAEAAPAAVGAPPAQASPPAASPPPAAPTPAAAPPAAAAPSAAPTPPAAPVIPPAVAAPVLPPATVTSNLANRLTLQLSNGGLVVIQLRPDAAPAHVERIQTLVRRGFYNGLIFHRVIAGFMAQTGDPQGIGTGGSDLPDLKAEFTTIPYLRGIVAAARTDDPNSANSQFFIMFAPSVSLWGKYTVLGRVIQGMDAVDKIAVGEPPAEPTKIVRASLGDAPVVHAPVVQTPVAPAPAATAPAPAAEVPAAPTGG